MRPKHSLLAISRWLGTIPSLAYAITYLLFIPTFAAVYYALPKHFYHSTVQRESVPVEEFNSIKRDLSWFLFERFEKEAKSNGRYAGFDSAETDKWFVRPNSITNFRIENNEAGFLMPVSVSIKNPDNHITLLLTIKFPLTPSRGMTFPEDREAEEDKLLSVGGWPTSGEFSDKESQLELGRILFPTMAAKSQDFYMGISIDLMDRLRNYSAGGAEGLGSEMTGNYLRMLYLSSVTITTLGFGDIVPITTASRLLVSAESVLGIVLIGLFLNALSFERGGAKNV